MYLHILEGLILQCITYVIITKLLDRQQFWVNFNSSQWRTGLYTLLKKTHRNNQCVDPNTLCLDPDPEIRSNLDPDPSLFIQLTILKKMRKWLSSKFFLYLFKTTFLKMYKNEGTWRQFWIRMVTFCQSFPSFSLFFNCMDSYLEYWSGSPQSCWIHFGSGSTTLEIAHSEVNAGRLAYHSLHMLELGEGSLVQLSQWTFLLGYLFPETYLNTVLYRKCKEV